MFSWWLSYWGFLIFLQLNLWLVLFVLNLYFKKCSLINGLFLVSLLTCVLIVLTIFGLCIVFTLWCLSFIEKPEILRDWLDLVLTKLCPYKILCLIIRADFALWFTIWVFFTENDGLAWIKIIARGWMTARRWWFIWVIFMLMNTSCDIIWKNPVMGLYLCLALVSVWHCFQFFWELMDCLYSNLKVLI